MRKKWRILVGILVVVIVVVAITMLNGDVQNYHHKYEGKDLSTDVTGIGRDDTYEVYLKRHEAVAAGKETIDVDVAAFEGDGLLEADKIGYLCLKYDGDIDPSKLPLIVRIFRSSDEMRIYTAVRDANADDAEIR